MKKIVPLIFLVSVMLALCTACATWLDTETEMVEPYYDDSGPTVYSSVLKATNYGELTQAIYKIIEDGSESGVVRFIGYDGVVEDDLETACQEISENTAIGEYAIYSLSGTVNKIVSYYEAEISVSYKVETSEIKDMLFVSDYDSLENIMTEALSSLKESVTIYIEPQAMQYRDVEKCVKEVFYADPMMSMYLPTVSVQNVFPMWGKQETDDTGVILKVNFGYPKSSEELEDMIRSSKNEIVSISLSTIGDDAEKIKAITETLLEGMQYVGTESAVYHGAKHSSEFTVYGAIVEKKAVSEGIALGFKAICDYEGITCIVVSGKYSGIEHYWNIVQLDGEYYHIDPSYCLTKGYKDYFLMSDEGLSDLYSWDRDTYPECSGDVDYSYLAATNISQD